MSQPTTVPGSAPATGPAVLDAEKLDVFRVAVAFQAAAGRLLPRGHAVLRDQLERASLSSVLNIAEGAARRSPRDKARSYTIARGSTAEAAALIDVLRVRGLAGAEECANARELAVRVVQMLTRLQQRMAG